VCDKKLTRKSILCFLRSAFNVPIAFNHFALSLIYGCVPTLSYFLVLHLPWSPFAKFPKTNQKIFAGLNGMIRFFSRLPSSLKTKEEGTSFIQKEGGIYRKKKWKQTKMTGQTNGVHIKQISKSKDRRHYFPNSIHHSFHTQNTRVLLLRFFLFFDFCLFF